MMKKNLFVFLFLYAGIIHAQEKYSITGYVKDSLSSENLIGATVSFNGQKKGVSTNSYGFFSITLPAAQYVITVSYVGYNSKSIELSLEKNISYNFLINQHGTANEEVIVY